MLFRILKSGAVANDEFKNNHESISIALTSFKYIFYLSQKLRNWCRIPSQQIK